MIDQLQKEKIVLLKVFFWLVVFAGLFSFFFFAHPVILFDADDWYYATYWRRPLPMPGEFNGIKVFPEVAMPFVSEIGALIFFPILGDYLRSLALVYALVEASIITAYVYMTELFVRKTMDVKQGLSHVISLFFLLFHFLVFKNNFDGNIHLFFAENATGIFHYTMSSLLSAGLVLWLAGTEAERGPVSKIISGKKMSYVSAGFLFLLFYLAVFSNLFCNIILISYLGTKALFDFFIAMSLSDHRMFFWKEWFGNQWLNLGVIGVWLIAVLMQLFDPRSAQVKNGNSGGLTDALKTFFASIRSINKMLLLVIAVILILAIIKCIRANVDVDFKRQYIKYSAEIVVSCFITIVYLVLMAAAADKKYLTLGVVLLSIFFYVFLEVAVTLGFILKGVNDYSSFALVIPFLLFVVISQTLNITKPFFDNCTVRGVTTEEMCRASNDIIKQFKEADDMGRDFLELHLTCGEDGVARWPYINEIGEMISNTLWRHGIISRKIFTTEVYDVNKNVELNIRFYP